MTMKRNFKTSLDKKKQEITVSTKLKLLPNGIGPLDSVNTTEVITYVEEIEKLQVVQVVKPDVAVNNRKGFNEGVWIFKVDIPLPPEKKAKPAKTKKEKKTDWELVDSPDNRPAAKKVASVHKVIAALADKLDTVEDE